MFSTSNLPTLVGMRLINRKVRNFLKIVIRYAKYFLFVSDFLVFNGSFFLALYIRFNTFNFPYEQDYMRLLLMGNILWVLLIGVFNTYRVIRFEPMEKNLIRSIRMIFAHFILMFLVTYIIEFRGTSMLVFLYYLGIVLTVSITIRITFLQILKYLRRRGINHRIVAIVGYNQNALELYDSLTSDVSYGYRVLGCFTDESAETTKDISVLGKLDEFIESAVQRGIEEVYIAVTTTNSSRVKRIIRYSEQNGIRVKLIPNFQKYTSSHSVDINYYDNVPVLSMRKEPLSSLRNKVLKRTFDIIFSLFVLVGILSWLYPIVYLLIKLDSQGPSLFKQKRSGLDGSVFTCYKFRTMVEGAEKEGVGTQRNDPRITKLGRFLRKSKIDELPQFINVLIGNMSVVGPRPHMLVHTETYSLLIDEFMIRHFVKPGITGWAQTVGQLRPEEKLEEMKSKVKNDIWYIENWSFLLDLKIIINTTLQIFKKDSDLV